MAGLTIVFLAVSLLRQLQAVGIWGNLKPSATEDALRALDKDNSGKVEKYEIEAFAKSQGLSADIVRNEFKGMDTNGDGELGADEISNVLSEPEVAQPPPGALVAAPASSASTLSGRDPVVAPPIVAPSEATISMPTFPARATMPVAGANAGLPSPDSTGSEILSSLPAGQNQQGAGSFIRAGEGAKEVSGIMAEAEQTGGKVLAEVFARTAALVLKSRQEDVSKATKLEALVKSLRGKSLELQHTAQQETVKAARDAAQLVLRSSIDEVHRLQMSAAEAEHESELHRSRAKASMQAAVQAQAQMKASVSQLSTEAV